MFLLVYVDDIVITGSCPKLIQSIIDAIQQTFPIRDLGSLHYFLGMEFKAQSYGNLLTQSRYLHDLLHKHGMVDCKPCQTPMQSSSTLSKMTGTPLPKGDVYRQIIGALQYATITRPDIAYSVNKLCQFMHHPTDVH